MLVIGLFCSHNPTVLKAFLNAIFLQNYEPKCGGWEQCRDRKVGGGESKMGGESGYELCSLLQLQVIFLPCLSSPFFLSLTFSLSLAVINWHYFVLLGFIHLLSCSTHVHLCSPIFTSVLLAFTLVTLCSTCIQWASRMFCLYLLMSTYVHFCSYCVYLWSLVFYLFLL